MVLKNGDVLTHPMLDSHSDLIRRFKLPDTTAHHQHFAKVELTPSDWMDVSTWTFRLDEETAPGWWADVAEGVEAELRRRADKMILRDGTHELLIDGCWIVGGTAKIRDVRSGRIVRVSGGTISGVWGGTIRDVRGGTIRGVRGGTISGVWGGTISDVNGGTISDVSGGTISGVRGGTISDVSGGTISDVSGGTIRDVNGGTISDVRGGTISGVWGGTISGVKEIYPMLLDESAKAAITTKAVK